MPSLAATAAFAIVAAAATTVSAQTPRLTDVEYIKAARCAGLAGAGALGGGDAAAFDVLLKDQRRAREGFIQDRARNARAAAMRDAGRADAAKKAALIAERDGICMTLVG